MKNLKSIFLAAAITVASLSATLTSCTSDPCKDVVCGKGTCGTDGKCVCPAGSEGTSCQTQSLSKLLGANNGAQDYNFSDGGSTSCGSYTGTFTATRSAADSTRVVFTNIGGFGLTATAYGTVNGTTLTIPTQTIINTSPAITISGSGTYNTATSAITGTYTSIDGASLSCTYNFVWTKK
jgi:hypothetical protein